MKWTIFCSNILSSLLFQACYSTSSPFNKRAPESDTVQYIPKGPISRNVTTTQTHLIIQEIFDFDHPKFIPVARWTSFAYAWTRELSSWVQDAGGPDQIWNGPEIEWPYQGFIVTYIPGDYDRPTWGDLGAVATTVPENMRFFKDRHGYRQLSVAVSRISGLDGDTLATVDICYEQADGGQGTDRQGAEGSVAVSSVS